MDNYSKIHNSKASDILDSTKRIIEQTKRLEEIRKRIEENNELGR